MCVFSLKEGVMLPNLGTLRLTAPTGELWPIEQRDVDLNGGEFEDPVTMRVLPLGSKSRTFRTQKDPTDRQRGYNWYDAESLAKWVKKQIEQGKTPVIDPFRVVMSRDDIEELRFEKDPSIPPYRLPPPPGPRDLVHIDINLDTRYDSSPKFFEMATQIEFNGNSPLMALVPFFSSTTDVERESVLQSDVASVLDAARGDSRAETIRRVMGQLRKQPGFSTATQLRSTRFPQQHVLRNLIRDLGARHLASACLPGMLDETMTIRLRVEVFSDEEDDPANRKAFLRFVWSVVDAPPSFYFEMAKSAKEAVGTDSFHQLRFSLLRITNWLIRGYGGQLVFEPWKRGFAGPWSYKPVPQRVLFNDDEGPGQKVSVDRHSEIQYVYGLEPRNDGDDEFDRSAELRATLLA
jgi:hypothetical protein